MSARLSQGVQNTTLLGHGEVLTVLTVATHPGGIRHPSNTPASHAPGLSAWFILPCFPGRKKAGLRSVATSSRLRATSTRSGDSVEHATVEAA
jgi:hypothetical protein